jgi:LAGLIDADG DNA endonuclease family protein
MGVIMNDFDLSYIAGFFDGEGCATIRMVKAKNGKRYPRLEARLAQNDRAVLDWVAESFGVGKVRAKKDIRNPNTNHEYAVTYRAARIFLTAIEPYLKVKKILVTSLLNEAGRE